MLAFVFPVSSIVPYVSPVPLRAFIANDVPDESESVVVAHVVAAPPTLLVKVPPTASVLPFVSVKFVAWESVKSCEDVAFCVTVQPPLEELNDTS
jgi:hypothetical protein